DIPSEAAFDTTSCRVNDDAKPANTTAPFKSSRQIIRNLYIFNSSSEDEVTWLDDETLAIFYDNFSGDCGFGSIIKWVDKCVFTMLENSETVPKTQIYGVTS